MRYCNEGRTQVYIYIKEFVNSEGMDYWEAIRSILYNNRTDGRTFHLETMIGEKLETLQEVINYNNEIFVVETVTIDDELFTKSSPIETKIN